MKNFRIYIALGILISVLFFLASQKEAGQFAGNVKKFLAGVFFFNSVTDEGLMEKYEMAKKGDGRIKILVVPGHDDGNGGTAFRDIREKDLNIEIAEEITNLLRLQDEFEVSLTKNREEYNPIITSYLAAERESIIEFEQKHKNLMGALVKSGIINSRSGIDHITAPAETALRLYGINKWANDNDMDIIIHAHFNDYPTRRRGEAGKYSGLAIYVPDRQFSNAQASGELAEKVFDRLTAFFAKSDMPEERAGIIEDQELIAIGANNTLDAAVLFIEYGYIYEPQFLNPRVRALAVKELAAQTYLGVLDFFSADLPDILKPYGSASLPHLFEDNLKIGTKGNSDVFALQFALSFDDLYPPRGKSVNDCPINGNFGPCTEDSVTDFQKKYGIEPAVGYAGPLTRAKLNEMFASQ
jgi:N-acetylmuramoyl-L-alanine amidase